MIEEKDRPAEDRERLPGVRTRAKIERGSRMRADWMPTEADNTYARALGLEPSAHCDEFRDFWLAACGIGAVKNDWSATWRNRCRTLAKRQVLPARIGAREPESAVLYSEAAL